MTQNWPAHDAVDRLKIKVRKFLLRSYVDDVRILNRTVAKSGSTSAGFEEAAPSVLTGDPYKLTPGSCVAVIGLNPKWQRDGWNGGWAQTDLLQTERELAAENVIDYEVRRARYFHQGNPQYYGPYFTRLGNRLARSLFPQSELDAREVFIRHAFKLDLLPWWSEDIRNVDCNKLTLPHLEPVQAWVGIVREFLSVLRPKLVIVNGSGFREFASQMLQARFTRFAFRSVKGSEMIGYRGSMPGSDLPIMMHKQVGARGGPGDDISYGNLVREWQLGLTERQRTRWNDGARCL